MTKAVLYKLIEEFPEPDQAKEPIFGIFQIGADPDESCITANKGGLLLFIEQLLRASKDAQDNSTVHIDSNASWIDKRSDINIKFIEFANATHFIPVQKDKQESRFVKLVPIGCVALIIIFIIAAIVGLGAMLKWIF
jgi:hypothetical protein